MASFDYQLTWGNQASYSSWRQCWSWTCWWMVVPWRSCFAPDRSSTCSFCHATSSFALCPGSWIFPSSPEGEFYSTEGAEATTWCIGEAPWTTQISFESISVCPVYPRYCAPATDHSISARYKSGIASTVFTIGPPEDTTFIIRCCSFFYSANPSPSHENNQASKTLHSRDGGRKEMEIRYGLLPWGYLEHRNMDSIWGWAASNPLAEVDALEISKNPFQALASSKSKYRKNE